MKTFHCDHCGWLLFFENTQCLKCSQTLAYLPSLGVVASLDKAENEGEWKSPLNRAEGQRFKLCRNYTEHQTCNWAVSVDDPQEYCCSCRLTRVLPNLEIAGGREAWFKLEAAKRRLVYALMQLELPLEPKTPENPQGMTFEFLADIPNSTFVLTGHDDGLITINIAEADDAVREQRRIEMHEPYRTVLGHFRHEIGHYYWDLLIKDRPRLQEFRELFGDESLDYGIALQNHYQNGAPADWQSRFVTTYASAHAWEDWAETWAHYMHMVDALETAASCGLKLAPKRKGDPVLNHVDDPLQDTDDFQRLSDEWFPLTYLLNNLNRGLGLPDGYPFVLSEPVLKKLEFIHDTIRTARSELNQETAKPQPTSQNSMNSTAAQPPVVENNVEPAVKSPVAVPAA